MGQLLTGHDRPEEGYNYVMEDMSVTDLSEIVVAQRYIGPDFESLGREPLTPLELGINEVYFSGLLPFFPVISLIQQANRLIVNCNSCGPTATKLCPHMAEVLLQVIKRDEYRIFFDQQLRYQRIRKVAIDYGLEDETDLDGLFSVQLVDGKIAISARLSSLLPVTRESLKATAQLLLPDAQPRAAGKRTVDEDTQRIMVLREHKYYKHLQIELYDAGVTKEGGIKNPLKPVSPIEMTWDCNDPLELKFLAAVSRFQQAVTDGVTDSVLTSLRSVTSNPLDLDCYIHDSTVSEKVNANALQRVKLNRITHSVELTVDKKDQFYEFYGKLRIGNEVFNLSDLEVRFSCFVQMNQQLYLVKDVAMIGAINFFKRRPGKTLIHQSKFKEFRSQILSKLEVHNEVSYPYIKTATTKQLTTNGFGDKPEKIIYLSDFGPHVMIIPVMRYGEAEIPIRTQTLIFAQDGKGNEFLVERKAKQEVEFMALLLKQHPFFEEQLEDHTQYFYLPKKRLLDEDWFLNAFEAWQDAGITILGFNELGGNKLNANKVKITVSVLSGINWFNAKFNIKYGKQRASLKHLHKAIRNKTKFVQLDDGTMGIIPEEWLRRFADYFNTGEVLDDETLRTSKSNYTAIERFYETEMLDAEVRSEIELYKQKFTDFEHVKNVEVPSDFVGTLRPYQVQGLNWLNFLDDFNFGGVLADDMGLGKTIQIIFFILSQRSKAPHNTNLLVVPTSLIFNWQDEVRKFAPSIKMHIVYGADREKNITGFNDYELVVTSYGTMLSDVNFLKDYYFNYVILDESQNIKNPSSQRYKAARLLKSRNKIAITGTPIENNTFDLYGQLSFANPGLLGTKQYFKDIYSSPIDKFKVKRRTMELQKKIQPFILRRTKEQVATELPEKTEMILYCEMEAEQRGIYNAYEKEFREFISATTQDQLPQRSMHVLKGITKLRQICNSPLLLKGEKLPGSASAKIDTLIEQIESKSPRHKILIFSQFTSMLDLIKNELQSRNIGFAYLTGATRNREAEVNEFQNNAAVRIFLVSLKAGGTGLNLTAADYVYLVDPWWNPAIENQAIDRCYRIGQEKHVIAVRLICPDTIEEKMMKLQESKKGLSNKLIHTDVSVFKSLTKDDLLDMLSH